MEQILKDFFNDNSVCVGLCDLKRKIDEVKFSFAPQHQFQQPIQKPVQQMQQKPQRQTLAQKFAAQQQEYAAKQAYLEEQRRKYALMQEQVQQMERQAALRQQQAVQQRVVQQKPTYKASQSVNASNNLYMKNTQNQAAPKQTVIVNGNMKKVISAAVPARY